MFKQASLILSATVLVAGSLLLGSAPQAAAETTYVVHTVRKVTDVTRYKDVWHTNYVYKVHRVVKVTRIQPIIHVHLVKRIHEKTVAVVHNKYISVTKVLPAKTFTTVKTIRVW